MQVSVGAIKISHAFHFELLVNVSMPSTNCQEPCREQIKCGLPFLLDRRFGDPQRNHLTILSSRSWRTTHGRHFRKWYHDQEILVTRFNTPLTPPSYGHCHRAGWQAAGGPASLCAGCAPSPSLWTCLNYVVRVSWFWCANFGNECYDLVATSETTKPSLTTLTN